MDKRRWNWAKINCYLLAFKYQEYQKSQLDKTQVNRALSIIVKNPKKIKSNNENDP